MSVWNFQKDFQFYPLILKRKNSNGPVVGYSYANYMIRIDKQEQNWIVRHNFSKVTRQKTFLTYEQAWDYLCEMIYKNRVKTLFESK